MAESKSPLVSDRDGTSQAQRLLAELETDYVGIDEHSLNDQLNFADAFAKVLKYYNSDNVEEGSWQGLLNPDGLEGNDLASWFGQIESFINQPESFTDDSFYNLHRPHFVLFLTFLQLLKNTQGQLNQLTARHLDFYYRQVLGLGLAPAQPDRVNVLIEPATQASSTLLPAGTLLAAGQDSLGKDLVYGTDSDLVVNNAKIAQLSSVYVNKQIIGIREAHEQCKGTKNDAVMDMLKIALGDPAPGDALPVYPPSSADVDYDFLIGLQVLVDFVGTDGLFMEIGEFRSLMRLKNNRGTAADSEWQTINGILAQIGKNRTKDDNFILTISYDRDFDANLNTALGVASMENYFDALPLVENIIGLYEQRTRQDVKDFIVSDIYLDVDTFNQMMQIKVRIDNEWQEINMLLERAGQRKQPDYQMVPTNPPDFDKNFQSALGTPAYPSVTGTASIESLDSFYDALLGIEAYFFMPLGDFVLLMDAASTGTASGPAWTKVYGQLALAYQNKVYTDHQAQLNGLRLGHTVPYAPPDNQKHAVQTMMQLALGIVPTDTSGLENRIKALLPAGTDMSLIEQAADGVELAEKDWASVCGTLELAWRNRVPTPVAQKINWLTLSAYGDTSAAKVPNSNNAGSWYTFGQREIQVFAGQSKPPEVTLGWAISSPVLCLAQGQRTVTLALLFKPEQFNTKKISALLKDNPPFLVELSTDKGWITADSVTVKIEDVQNSLKSLSWTLNFAETIAPICVLGDVQSGMPDSSWPMLRILLQPRFDAVSNCYVTDYPLFQGLLLEKLVLDVAVKGLASLQLQNDDGTLTSGKPFEPFGSSPAIGARLYFGHSELMIKKLKTLDINLEWMGVPNAKLGDYYQNYSAPISDNSAFKSKIILADQHLELFLDESALFNQDDANQPTKLSIADLDEKIQASRFGYLYDRQLPVSDDEDVTAWQRYWLLELAANDFQHAAYPAVAAAKSIDLAAVLTNGGTVNPDSYKVNPPYTPKLKSLRLDYTASIELALTGLHGDSADQAYHLHPFGYAPMRADPETGGYSFLPAYNNEGELYFGLSDVQPAQTLSILLQMAEGTANPDLEAAVVQWSVLSDNCWLSLNNGQLQADATNGLLQSGIITLQLDEIAPSTLLPPDLYWLRVAVAEGCDSVCDSIGTGTQAVIATFANRDNSDDHLDFPLPASTIQSLVESIGGIAAASQPYTSFGGRPKEQGSHFNMRVSERLRHKQRAVSLWDYEHLVLEQFPGIYKTKAIPAGLAENLGQVTLLVIPDVRNRLPFNSFAPKVPARTLDDIEMFLAGHIPLGVSIIVKNACYLPVRVRFSVRFWPGCDTGFYSLQLNDEVNQFLSPWAYEQGKDIVIGGKIYANAIIDFIERLAYVDYVADFTLFLGDESGVNFQMIEKPPLTDSSEGYFVVASGPDVVLVAARTHDIDLITEVNYGDQVLSGIDYMKLELDFVVD